MAQGESLVRNRCHPGAQAARYAVFTVGIIARHMKLLASLASRYTRKVRVVLAEKKIECELELVDVNPVENPANAHNPLGKVPTLVLDDGTALYDSRVIVEFLDARAPINR